MSLVKDTLHELFKYEEGKLYWKSDRSQRVKAGMEAGWEHNGYIYVKINGKQYSVHRIVYVMFEGHIPQRTEIDHINGNKSDNRIENLRAVSHKHNMFNTKATGVTYRSKTNKWLAQIGINGNKKHLGTYETEQEARNAYLKAKEKYHKIKEVK